MAPLSDIGERVDIARCSELPVIETLLLNRAIVLQSCRLRTDGLRLGAVRDDAVLDQRPPITD
jgi:hypothetical protein